MATRVEYWARLGSGPPNLADDTPSKVAYHLLRRRIEELR